MSAVGADAGTSVACYARRLLEQAHRLVAAQPADRLAPALAALDDFLAAPRGDTFIAATRALRQARLAAPIAELHRRHDANTFERGVAAVSAAPGLAAEHARLFEALPVDGQTGRRLLALAQLLEVHHELAGLTAAASRELRRKLGLGDAGGPNAAAVAPRRPPATAPRRSSAKSR